MYEIQDRETTTTKKKKKILSLVSLTYISVFSPFAVDGPAHPLSDP